MRIVFFGTPEFVVPVLESLHRTFSNKKGESPIVAVVTQKPALTGRKQYLAHSAVDAWGFKHKVPIFYSSPDVIDTGVKADIGILAAYGEIIPPRVLAAFPHGILNIHPSFLPKFRGASPVQGALAMGEKTTGVTIMKLDAKLDHGDIISQFEEEIKTDDTNKTLTERLFAKSTEVLIALLEPYLAGKIKPKKQNEKEVSFTTQIKKIDGFIPPSALQLALEGKAAKEKLTLGFLKDTVIKITPKSLNNLIRALYPWPCTWTDVKMGETNKSRLKIISAHLEDKALVPDQVQLEGKEIVSWDEFKRGYPAAKFI